MLAFQRFALEQVPAARVAEELGMSANAVFIAKSRVLTRLRQNRWGFWTTEKYQNISERFGSSEAFNKRLYAVCQHCHQAPRTMRCFQHKISIHLPMSCSPLHRGDSDDPDFAAIESHLELCETCCTWIAKQDDHTLLNLAREVATLGMLHTGNFASDNTIALPEVLADHPRYRVIEQIGSGGMGAIYKAEHRLMHRTVALKVVHPRWLSAQSAIERFEREVRMAGKLSHPHIVASYDADQAGGMHFLVMEFVDGVSLDQHVKATGQCRCPLPANGYDKHYWVSSTLTNAA